MALRHDTCNATDMSNLGRRTFRIVRYITCDGYSNVTLLRSLGGYTLALARRSVATHVHHARRTMRGDSLPYNHRTPQDPLCFAGRGPGDIRNLPFRPLSRHLATQMPVVGEVDARRAIRQAEAARDEARGQLVKLQVDEDPPRTPTFRRNFSAAIGSCDDDDFISPQRVQCGHQSLKVGRSLDSWEDQARSLTQVRSHSIWVWVGRRFWELFLKRAKLTRLGRTRPVLR